MNFAWYDQDICENQGHFSEKNLTIMEDQSMSDV
jgi:hypothetical protein